MRRKLALAALTAGLTLALAAPVRAATTISPGVLDFGTFSASAPPSGLLTANVVPDSKNRYLASLGMTSGQASFFPSSDCAYSEGAPCTVSVRVVTPVLATGPVSGVIELGFGDQQTEFQLAKETRTVEVRANITAATIAPPTIVPPTTPVPDSPAAAPQPKPKKKACPKKGAKASAAKPKGKACGKGKGKKGKGRK